MVATVNQESDYSFHASMPVEMLVRNPQQPRKTFPVQALETLANSFSEVGIMQPIVCRPTENGDAFQIIAGERRWRAAQIARMETVPVIIRRVDNLTAMTMAMVENLHREGLNLLEEAAGYQVMHDEYQLTHEEIARRCSRDDKHISRDRVTRVLRLFQLPVAIQEMVREETLTFGHAEVLLSEPVQKAKGMALQLAQRCIKEGWSVRQLKKVVGEMAGTKKKPAVTNKTADWRDIEERLTDYLGSPMQINKKGKSFEISIKCNDLDILEGVLEKIYSQ